MTFQPGATVYTQAFGSRPEDVEVPHIEGRPPTTTDNRYPVGKRWIDNVGNASYELTSLLTSGNVTTANWSATGGGSTELSSLTGTTGTATPTGGNIQIAGTANQINTAATGSIVTLSLPNLLVTPGPLQATGSISSGADITATGNVVAGLNVNVGNTGLGFLNFSTAGSRIFAGSFATNSTAGANSFGTVTLAAGTVTVNTTAVSGSCVIALFRQDVGTTGANPLGQLSVGTKTPGTSFVINSFQQANATALQTTDVSNIFWMIVEHI